MNQEVPRRLYSRKLIWIITAGLILAGRLLVCVTPCVTAAETSGEMIYSWTDETGVKQFSNTLPPAPVTAVKATRALQSVSQDSPAEETTMSCVTNENETRVYIRNNQIMVPVKLGNNGQEVSTLMLLDTGATTTSIHSEVADAFGYFDYRPSKSVIADGSTVDTKRTRLDYIIVGPFKVDNFDAVVVDYNGPAHRLKGLLGMNFLKEFRYQVDYDRQVIKWY